MNEDKKIMLLDGYSYRTLACVRSFGKRGINFVVGGESRYDISLFSKYCKEKFIYTDPGVNISDFISDINYNIRNFKINIVLPTSEKAILAFDRNREKINGDLLIPKTEEIKMLFSKSNTLNIAKKLGVLTPKTFFLNDENINKIIKKIDFPAVIKAECSENVMGNKIVKGGNTSYVYNGRDLLDEYYKRSRRTPNLIVQEFIDGFGIGVSGIFKNGKAIALFGHRRIREKNPLGGPSALAESISIDKNLLESTKKIIGKIGYTGPAMVEYKVDRNTNTPYLMEINGRFWGSILLPLAAGIDLPYIWWKVINDMEVKLEETKYKAGIRGRYLLGDTKSLLYTLKGRPKNWQGYFPTRREALEDYILSYFDNKTANLMLYKPDIKPFFGQLLGIFKDIVKSYS